MMIGLNFLALAVSCLLAHLWPQETFLGAYALLGPGHYLTEMSWLHDRGYLVRRPQLYLALCAFTLLGIFVWWGAPMDDAVLLALVGGLVAGGRLMRPRAFVCGAVFGAVLGFWGGQYGWWPVVVVVALLPTLIHVFGFTGMFVVSGAAKARKPAEWLVPGFMLAGAFSFVALPTVDFGRGWLAPSVWMFFSSMYSALGVKDGAFAIGVTGFVGFAYCYHYLNWFLKTGILGWHKVGVDRLFWIGGLWAALVSCWVFGGPEVGFMMTLPFSLGHVLLEFPLDLVVARRMVAGIMPGRLAWVRD